MSESSVTPEQRYDDEMLDSLGAAGGGVCRIEDVALVAALVAWRADVHQDPWPEVSVGDGFSGRTSSMVALDNSQTFDVDGKMVSHEDLITMGRVAIQQALCPHYNAELIENERICWVCGWYRNYLENEEE